MKGVQHISFPVFLLLAINVYAQTDTLKKVSITTGSSVETRNPAFVKDTIKINNKVDSIAKHDPRKATMRSALIPGWGQAYNKEYWKIPLVYGALGVPGGFYIYNTTWYRRSKQAFEKRIIGDTSAIHPKLEGLSAESLRFYRNAFKKNKDYSILYFLLAWGLNVADATVFGHLKNFDVSDDLSFQVKPGYSPLANTSGLSFVIAVKNSADKKLHSFSRSRNWD